MKCEWSTIIEEWDEDAQEWVFFSQQSVKPSEQPMTDDEYLTSCCVAFSDFRFRIRPRRAPASRRRFAVRHPPLWRKRTR